MRYLSKQIYQNCVLKNGRIIKNKHLTVLNGVYSGQKTYSTLNSNDPDPNLKPVKANLILKGGKTISGYSFGYNKSKAGELVFNTGLVGYLQKLFLLNLLAKFKRMHSFKF